MHPFWPEHSPHFLACRLAVRPVLRRLVQSADSTSLGQGSVVVGLSGGPDSLALVAACLAEGVGTHAVIVDHQLQEGSGQVAEQARRTAQQLGATAEVVRIRVPEGSSLEAQARKARYQALLQVAPAEVLIAHTLDDQAETYLLGGFRGNPGGMAEQEGRILRPFLTVRRADTEGACQELGLTPWQDPQNSDPGFLRVQVRTQILPGLAQALGFDPAPALAQAATRCALNRQAVAQMATHLRAQHPSYLDTHVLAEQPGAVRRTAIEQFLRGAGAPVNRQILTQVENLVIDWHGQGAVSLGSCLDVQRVNGKIVVSNDTTPDS